MMIDRLLKPLFIVLLLTIIFVLASFLYKNSKTPVFNDFPLLSNQVDGVEVPFFLYVFFSQNNCVSCLEIIDVLNQVPPFFKVIGVVPENELKMEKSLRNNTGAAFELVSSKAFHRFIPAHQPTVVGIAENGEIFFVFAAVPGIKDYFKKYLNSLYEKIYPSFLKKRF